MRILLYVKVDVNKTRYLTRRDDNSYIIYGSVPRGALEAAFSDAIWWD